MIKLLLNQNLLNWGAFLYFHIVFLVMTKLIEEQFDILINIKYNLEIKSG